MSTVIGSAYNILMERWGLCRGMDRRMLVVYDIMGFEGALFVPPSCSILVLVECVVELCKELVLVYSDG